MFENGSEILRFDCHLHTVSDKEFKYDGEPDKFISSYVDKLKSEGIGVGVITNHNKFDYEQYKALKKAANRNGIFILPGVELSVKEGASSVHMLVVFNPVEWICNGIDHISRMVNALFLGIDDPGNENTCTEKDLLTVINEMDKQNKDYFIVCAHVEQKKGFWEECGGSLIEKLASDVAFKRRVLGFQKVRTRDNIKKVHDWMGYDIAFVEGSDPKTIEEIGKGDKKNYIKIGEASYGAVKYALMDYNNRVFDEKPVISHGYINKMKCVGGKLDNQIFSPSHELNTLIGIRGSGKSSVLEVLRYALNKEPAQDEKYKNELVKAVLGSGGQIELEIVDKFNKKYVLKRIYGERSTLYDGNGNILNIPVESVLKNALYFGQKDLALTRKGYEYELLNKIIGDKVPDMKREIVDIQKQLIDDIDKLRTLGDIPEQITDLTTENATLEHKLKIYQEKGLDEKLKKQTSCNADLIKLETLSEWVKEMIQSLEEVCSKDGRELLSLQSHVSQYNSEIFEKLAPFITQTNEGIDSVKQNIEMLKKSLAGICSVKEELMQKIDSLKDEFAEIKREINDEQLDADSYVTYKKKLAENNEKIAKLKECLRTKESICLSIQKGFDVRNENLRKTFIAYQNATKEINQQQDQLAVNIEFKGQKEVLKDKLMTFFKGTGLSEVKYTEMSNDFTDLAAIIEEYYLHDGERIKQYCTDIIYAKVAAKIADNYKEMVIEDTPDKINITYHGKLLSKHSLGQRASALILFILTQHDSDVIIVDQPEDDLDNQVIYEELIQTIKKEKEDMQFIFATHNANIPVLGDAERVVTVQHNDDESIELKCGTIDSEETHNDIVNIMEGGKEAFKKRNEIYGAWS